ncbi:MAG: aldo/keto reductase, partial [Oscillospiraceae bacterium]|nr:aldo/keto reductase [Oscillospiraceae bacterium]
MNYRINPKNGDRLSILGFGCMRFPRSFDDTEKLVRRAIEGGVNYFDTAYVYPGNEATLGRALRGYRDRVKLATKMPPYLVKTREDFDKIFNTQLERLQTDHIDYYLLHMLTDTNVWERLLGLGALEWIAEKKASGQIVNLGFSYHGGRDDFVQIVDAYDWDFCMIQYNFLDE